MSPILAIWLVVFLIIIVCGYFYVKKVEREDGIEAIRDRLDNALSNRRAKAELVDELKARKKGFKGLTDKQLEELETFINEWSG